MIKCDDGITIHSWLLYHPSSSPNDNKEIPTIIFFHGNAGNIGLRLPNAVQMYHYLQANIWLVEYRGYGDSDDAIVNEVGLKLDAEAVLKYAHDANNNMSNVNVKKLFVFGRSLGGAVAFHLAKYAQVNKYPLAGVLVENTFVSVSTMVDHLMPYVAPLKSFVLRIGWNSGEIAPTINTPTMFLAGAQDTLVPHGHMLELFARMKNSKMDNLVRMHVVENGTHNETWMQGGKEYWVAIKRFLQDVLSAEDHDGRVVKDGKNGVFQRKASTFTTVCTEASISSVTNESIEVSMGSNDGEDAAGMISSVGNFMGMAKEATRSITVGRGGSTNVPSKKEE
jgi:pimeloyl-ACP methyl ester carboxylesterase